MRLDLHKVGARSRVCGRGGCVVDVAGFLFNVVKEDIKCIEISSIDAVHNRTMTLA